MELGGTMKRFIVVMTAVVLILAFAGTACGSGSLVGTTWTGTVALTSVSVDFDAGGQFTSSHFGSGEYSVEGNQVSLVPSGQGQTRVFIYGGNLMEGAVDGWPVTLTKQER
jgi:hypothetical protein